MKKRRCWKCKKIFPLDAEHFYRNKNEIAGLQYICKECSRKNRKRYYHKNVEKERKYSKEYRASNKEYFKEWRRKYLNTVKGKYNSYKCDANRRNKKEWNLTLEEFERIIKQPCAYCGEKGENGLVGVDRLDNNKGYVKGNVIPCCAVCNHMKWTMSKEEFIAKCRKIVKNNCID